MNDSVMRYLLRKMTRTEVCEASIKAIRTKEGMNFQVGGARNRAYRAYF